MFCFLKMWENEEHKRMRKGQSISPVQVKGCIVWMVKVVKQEGESTLEKGWG